MMTFGITKRKHDFVWIKHQEDSLFIGGGVYTVPSLNQL